MSCKEKDCSFVSNCPEMLEFHAKTSHCSSSNIDTLAKEQENSEPKIKLVKVSSPESNSGSGHIDTGEDSVLVSQPVTLKRKCDEAEAAASCGVLMVLFSKAGFAQMLQVEVSRGVKTIITFLASIRC